MPLFVEFVGLPGAGKTTTARRVAKILRSKGYHCDNRPTLVNSRRDRHLHRLLFLWYRLMRPVLFATVLGFWFSLRPLQTGRMRFLTQLIFLKYYIWFQRRSEYDVILLGQSAIQCAWSASVYAGVPDSAAQERLFRPAYRDAVGSIAFVLFEIDAATATDRIIDQRKGGSRFDHLPKETVRPLLTTHTRHLNSLLGTVLRETQAPLLRIDATRALEVNAAEIAEFIESLLQARSTRGDRAETFALGSIVPGAGVQAEPDKL